jgi:aryl-alcohol dehydrogenase-like predicted oxidoreductase
VCKKFALSYTDRYIETHIMKYKIFGQKTGLRVSELVLGAGNFGTSWGGHGADEHESRRLFERYLEAGGNTIDTADAYQVGESETILGDLIANERDNIILSSKFTMGAGPKTGLLTVGNSRKNLIRSVEASLKRLKTDRLDIYWAHLSDGQTPIEEIVRGFDDLVRDGKILYAGFSNFPAWRIALASQLADLRGWSPVAGIQIEYSLIERTPDRDLLPMAEALGLGVAFWSPLAGGLLTGKYRSATADPESRLAKWNGAVFRKEDDERASAILDKLESISKETGVKMLDIALAWVRQKHDHTSLSAVTIIGPRTVSQLEDNLASLSFTLSAAYIKQLDDVSDVSLGSPHQIIADTAARIMAAGSGAVELKHAVI